METILRMGISFFPELLVALTEREAKSQVEWGMLRSETREVFQRSKEGVVVIKEYGISRI